MINQQHALREKKIINAVSKLRKIRAQLTEINQKHQEVQKEYYDMEGQKLPSGITY